MEWSAVSYRQFAAAGKLSGRLTPFSRLRLFTLWHFSTLLSLSLYYSRSLYLAHSLSIYLSICLSVYLSVYLFKVGLLGSWVAGIPMFSVVLQTCSSLYEEAIEASGNRSRGACYEKLESTTVFATKLQQGR